MGQVSMVVLIALAEEVHMYLSHTEYTQDPFLSDQIFSTVSAEGICLLMISSL